MDLNLAHIGVYVCNLERSVRFYQDVLDFVQIFRYENQGTPIAFLQNGTCVLELIEKPASAGRTDGRVDHIALAVTDLAQAHRELLARGVVFETDRVTTCPACFPGGASWILFRGPDGERLELNQTGGI